MVQTINVFYFNFLRYETELYENIIIRKPAKYNNTKLIDFISENKYKINDPKELEALQISGDMTQCCNWANKNSKSCETITKPPGLYQTVMKTRKSNSCPIQQNLFGNELTTNTKRMMEKGLDIEIKLREI